MDAPIVTNAQDELLRARMSEVWANPTGWRALSIVNHRAVGRRFIFTGLAFFVIAGCLALTMLIQLSRSGLGVLSPDAYNQFFTMHGTTMMFLFAVPIMEGVGVYLVPTMLGARDAAFPRLNAFGYWVYLLAGGMLVFSLVIGQAPDQGWFSYVPLAGPEFSPGRGVDFWAVALTFLEISGLVAAVEVIVTIFRLRAPGMTISRMPVLVWAMLVQAFMIVFAMPPLIVGSLMLELDRSVGTQFFNPGGGGNVLLWQHLFWWFGHPEVYIVAVPAFGMVSMVIPIFVRRKLVAYLPVVFAILAIGLVSFGLWVHHMFAVELSILGMSLFAAASMAIAIPSGVQVFTWIGTIWEGRKLLWRTPFLWMSGFLVMFIVGGLTGIMLAAIPFDRQVTDSYFVTAHFHYVLIGGSVFPLIGALYYWWPKITGRLTSERLGRISFWLAIVGFSMTFFTMHYTGFMGMPRRVQTYMTGFGWDNPMLISAVGGFLLALGFALTLVNLFGSMWRGPRAGADPWGGDTLEWSIDSPPPAYAFLRTPHVHSRTPLWDAPPSDADVPRAYDASPEERQTPATGILDARPLARSLLPGPSFAPLYLAVSVFVMFLAPFLSYWLVPAGVVLSIISLLYWFRGDWLAEKRKGGA